MCKKPVESVLKIRPPIFWARYTYTSFKIMSITSFWLISVLLTTGQWRVSALKIEKKITRRDKKYIIIYKQYNVFI